MSEVPSSADHNNEQHPQRDQEIRSPITVTAQELPTLVVDISNQSTVMDNILELSSQGSIEEERYEGCSTTCTPEVPPRTEEMYIMGSSQVTCDFPTPQVVDISNKASVMGSIETESHEDHTNTHTPEVPPRTKEMYIIADSVPCASSIVHSPLSNKQDGVPVLTSEFGNLLSEDVVTSSYEFLIPARSLCSDGSTKSSLDESVTRKSNDSEKATDPIDKISMEMINNESVEEAESATNTEHVQSKQQTPRPLSYLEPSCNLLCIHKQEEEVPPPRPPKPSPTSSAMNNATTPKLPHPLSPPTPEITEDSRSSPPPLPPRDDPPPSLPARDIPPPSLPSRDVCSLPPSREVSLHSLSSRSTIPPSLPSRDVPHLFSSRDNIKLLHSFHSKATPSLSLPSRDTPPHSLSSRHTLSPSLPPRNTLRLPVDHLAQQEFTIELPPRHIRRHPTSSSSSGNEKSLFDQDGGKDTEDVFLQYNESYHTLTEHFHQDRHYL